jgi:two-component system OmpR family response regulator
VRVGVCEDDHVIRDVLVRGLRAAGHDVLTAHNGGEAVSRFGVESGLDVIVMDIGLPDSDGRDVCLALRSSGQHAPVLFLTALGETHNVLAGFRAGGDDYVTKPVELSVLNARLEALARRAPAQVAEDGALMLDPRRHTARCDDREVLLSPTEFRMLAVILGRKGEVVRRHEVVAAGWPDGAMVSENTVDAFMHKIRSKLQEIDSPVAVETVRGLGFRVA